MIQEFLIKDSKHFKKYQYHEKDNKMGINADTCILIDNLEVYYNKSIETLYIENKKSIFEKENRKNMTRKMFEELLNYVNWNNWIISLYYYDYGKAMITIHRIRKNRKLKEDMIAIGSLAENMIEEFKPTQIINAK